MSLPSKHVVRSLFEVNQFMIYYKNHAQSSFTNDQPFFKNLAGSCITVHISIFHHLHTASRICKGIFEHRKRKFTRH